MNIRKSSQDHNVAGHRLHATSYFRRICVSLLFLSILFSCRAIYAQDPDLEFSVDVAAPTVPLPSIFKPNIDLSGRGFHQDASWPQALAAQDALTAWQETVGYKGIYRIQYNLWEISQLAKENALQSALLAHYENTIKKISDAGGTVIVNFFGTPPGLGKVLDKKSHPWDLKAFKELTKKHMRELSCKKKYNVWYEVWTAPDLDAFFLGGLQEYLGIYRAVAEGAKELEAETKIHIPVGGPSVSWWFQNFDGNTILAPEKSLVYELIKYCARYKLPLDFISWHAYSTDPQAEQEMTGYKKTSVALIRDWLSYFKFNDQIPLIVDEWNYDNGTNIAPERQEKSFICASFIPARLKSMYKAGIDQQLFFSLEDFQDNPEGITRNVGVFWFDPQEEPKHGNKSIYNAFKMLAALGNAMYTIPQKTSDEFVDIIATRKQNTLTLVVYNYIDEAIFMNYLSKNIATLNNAERKSLLNLLKTGVIQKLMRKQLEVIRIRAPKRVKIMLAKAQGLHERAIRYMSGPRTVKLNIKNLALLAQSQQAKAKQGVYENTDDFIVQRYSIDSACGIQCDFAPTAESSIDIAAPFQETLTVAPYSVTMIKIKKRPKAAEINFSLDVTASVDTSALEQKEAGAKENSAAETKAPEEKNAQNSTH